MAPSAYKTTPQNHAISWSFFRSNSNGKEKDWESGFHYYGARYYWSEMLTSFISVDRYADKYPFISSYAYCAWNPIRLTDLTGDTLDIRGGQLAENDILSIVDPQYRNRISALNGRVNVDVVGLSSDDIEMDAGLSVLNRMATSDCHYLYQAEEVLNSNGEPIDLWNNSVTPHMETQKNGDPLPIGYQGWVVIHPNVVFSGSEGGEYYGNRPSMVFHELEENYQRTDGKLPYKYLDPRNINKEDPNRLGAHGIAIQKAERLTPSAKSVFGTEGAAYKKKIIK